MFYFTEFYKWC